MFFGSLVDALLIIAALRADLETYIERPLELSSHAVAGRGADAGDDHVGSEHQENDAGVYGACQGDFHAPAT